MSEFEVATDGRRLRPEQIQVHERLYSPVRSPGADHRQRLVHEGGVSFGRPIVRPLPYGEDPPESYHRGIGGPRAFALVALSFDIDEPADDRRLLSVDFTIELETRDVVAHSLWPTQVATPLDGERCRCFTVRSDLSLGRAFGRGGAPCYRYTQLHPKIASHGNGRSRFSWTFTAQREYPLRPSVRVVFAVLDMPAGTKQIVGTQCVEATIIRSLRQYRAKANGRVLRLDTTAVTPTVPHSPDVFISYAHDSIKHVRQVLAFAEFLTSKGITVHLDQWADDRRRDWASWAMGGITRADFVVVVASPDYRSVGDGHAVTMANKGARSEAAIIRDLLHRDRDTWLPKLLPVILPGGELDGIPDFLQPYTASTYPIYDFTAEGAEDLLRVLTGQPARVRPALGAIPLLPPHSTAS